MRRPGRDVLIVFLLATLIGGSNFVGVRFSNRELEPFWGAGLRFAIAAVLLLGYSRWRRVPLPPRSALPGVLVFGTVNFGLTYVFAYYGLNEAPAAVASTLVATVPLMTFIATSALGMERFRWTGLLGALISLVGVAVVFADQIRFDVPFDALVALLLNAVSLASGTILLKRLPRTHPVGTNAVAMVPGALLLIVLAIVTREHIALPTRPEVIIAFLYLATIGSIAFFAAIVYVVARWTASASVYMMVLFPVVTVALGALLAGETVSMPFVLGTIFVMAGTYVGALTSRTQAGEVEEAAA